MSYTIIIPKPVRKQLESLPSIIQSRLLEAILPLAEDPRLHGAIKLKGYDNEYRIRVGDYRVRYEIDDINCVVLLLHCKHRKVCTEVNIIS